VIYLYVAFAKTKEKNGPGHENGNHTHHSQDTRTINEEVRPEYLLLDTCHKVLFPAAVFSENFKVQLPR
jgi:hypothetical protein